MGEKMNAIWLRYCLAESEQQSAGERFVRARQRLLAKVPRLRHAWLLLQCVAGLWSLEAVIKDKPEYMRLVVLWERALELDPDVRARERGE